MSSPLAGRFALVTGCGRKTGIGRGVALALAAAGADVAVCDVAPSGTRNAGEQVDDNKIEVWGLDALVAEIGTFGRRGIALVGDVGAEVDVERMVHACEVQLGGVDVLVNNAAAPHGADRNWTWEVPPAAFDEVLRVNTRGTFLMCAAVVRSMLARGAPGRIINIASVSGLRGIPQRAAYSASKFAVVGLTQVIAAELADKGITVNAVCPGAVETPRNAARTARAAALEGSDATLVMPAKASAVGRMGVPDDIARAVLYFADPGASFVTGQSLAVDGGGVSWG